MGSPAHDLLLSGAWRVRRRTSRGRRRPPSRRAMLRLPRQRDALSAVRPAEAGAGAIMTTEAERQAARYEEDPDGVLRWFMDHPEESKVWETAYFQHIVRSQRRSLIFRVRLAIVS